jgi:hypothetical protein
MKTQILLISLSFLITASAQDNKPAATTHTDISVDGTPKVRYMHAYDTSTKDTTFNTYKVYHHVFAPEDHKEQFLTKEIKGQFPHHRGIFYGFSKLKHAGKSYDLWHMNKGEEQVHREFSKNEETDDAIIQTAEIDWNDSSKKTMLKESRTLMLHKKPEGAWLLADFTNELRAVNGDVELNGDPEHAGFQFRPNRLVGENKSAKYTFPTEKTPDLKKEKDQQWVAMTFDLEGKKYTVQLMRHPGNPKNSTWSAYRDYGRFGYYFVHTVKDKESLTIHNRIRITKGEAPSRETLQAQYDAYVK